MHKTLIVFKTILIKSSNPFIIVSIIIYTCIIQYLCHCKNQILAGLISQKHWIRRQEILFHSSRNPNPLPKWFVALSLNVCPPQILNMTWLIYLGFLYSEVKVLR